MKKFNIKESTQKGSLMVEALALLGLITMVTPILYKKAAERTTELQDINVATQMRMVSSAVDDFIKDNYNEIGDTHPEDIFKLSDAERDKLDEYLPYGFSTQRSKMFKDFDISVRKRNVTDVKGKTHSIYTTAVLAPLQEDITIMRSSKIASMIGANGGVYRPINRDGAIDYRLEGVQGTWEANLADYDFMPAEGDPDLKEGSLVVISSQSISSAKGDVSSDDVLYRIDDGDEAKNTMQTTLYMDGHELRGLSELIAQGGDGNDVIIGKDDSLTSNLIVTGTSNLRKSLNVEGDTTLNSLTAGDTTVNNLTANGDTKLGSTTITGNLVQSGGDATFNSENFNVNANKNVKIDSAGDTTIGGTNVNIAGDTSVNVNAGGNGITINQDGNTVTGDTVFNDGNVTINQGDLIVNGGEIIMIPETPEEETAVETDWLYADKGIKVGPNRSGTIFAVDSTGTKVLSGNLNVRDNLTANDTTVDIANKSFAVGGVVGTSGNMINVSSDSAFVGYSYAADDDAHNGLKVKSAELILRNAAGNLKMNTADGVILEGGSNSRVKLNDSGVTIGVGTDGSEDAKIVADASKVGFENKKSGDGASGSYSLYLESGDLKLNSKSIVADEYGVAIAGEGGDISSEKSVNVDNAGVVNENSILNGSRVAISRKGILEVKAPADTTDKGGFIRARRLVSDVKYPDAAEFQGATSSGGTPSKAYDYYQVNPAYTSVMNDIKLASRGGARLSDALPDFINKGIYVVDNTYSNDVIGDWNNMTVSDGKPTLGANAECSNNSCVASPWLGFVPAPQCPKNYAKVITINPIRWRMSEVYAIYGADEWRDHLPSNYGNIIGGSDFKKYFFRQTDPKQATFELSTAGGDEHTHVIESGYPLTYQTNTWLNTTISEVYTSGSSVEDFMGWHTIMGFVYRPTQYSQLLSDLEQSTSNTEIYWNIFPVYAQDMAAVANVYCYFDRHPLTSSTGTARKWTWGSNTPVYQYDQLNNYRQGYSKGAVSGAEAWSGYNDPQLEYDDAW